jgi:hypothetical protein
MRTARALSRAAIRLDSLLSAIEHVQKQSFLHDESPIFAQLSFYRVAATIRNVQDRCAVKCRLYRLIVGLPALPQGSALCI